MANAQQTKIINVIGSANSNGIALYNAQPRKAVQAGNIKNSNLIHTSLLFYKYKTKKYYNLMLK